MCRVGNRGAAILPANNEPVLQDCSGVFDFDFDSDSDVDLGDFVEVQAAGTG